MEKISDRVCQEHIFRLENRRRELMRPEYLRLGLTIGQGQPRILMYLLTEDGCSQREIAENCHLDVTTLSRTLDRLAEKGLLERRINPQSRRECQIFLTEEGRETAAEVCSCFRETEKKMCSGLTEKELEALEPESGGAGKFDRSLKKTGILIKSLYTYPPPMFYKAAGFMIS